MIEKIIVLLVVEELYLLVEGLIETVEELYLMNTISVTL